MTPNRWQPAFLGGLFIGVLSALPVINLGNCCCCLWVVSGGVLAAWLLQAAHPAPISTADAALTGLLAGAIGAVVGTLVAIPVNLATGPFLQGLIDQVVQNPDFPEDLREALEQARADGPQALAISILAGTVWLVVSLGIYSVFAAAGGAIGAVLFRKQPPSEIAPPPPFVPPRGEA